MTCGNGSVVWTTRRQTGRLAYCVLWLDQETEDKVAVGLIAIEQLRRTPSNSYYIIYMHCTIPDICYSQLLHVLNKVDRESEDQGKVTVIIND